MMKATLLSLFLAGAVSLVTVESSTRFVYENPVEFRLTGDFNGDGRQDYALVERTSGLIRAALRQADGSHHWLPVRSSGLTDLTSASVGPVIHAGIDSVVLASPVTNRIHVLDLRKEEPVQVYPENGLPLEAMVVGVVNGQDSLLNDLLVVTESNRHFLNLRERRGDAFVQVASQQLVHPLDALNPVAVRGGRIQMVGGILRGGDSEVFQLLSTRSSGATVLSSVPGFPQGSFFTGGQFEGNAYDFVFYVPNDSTLQVARLEGSDSTPEVASPQVHVLPNPVQSLAAVAADGGDLLIVVFQGGLEGNVYRYAQEQGFLLLASFAPSADADPLTGIIPGGDGGEFFALSGPAGVPSMQSTQLIWDGASLSVGQVHMIPKHQSITSRTNIFFYDGEPLVEEDARLISVKQRGDWTSDLRVANGGSVVVDTERYLSQSAGLSEPETVNLGAAPNGFTHGLGNQLMDAVSVFSYSGDTGPVVEVIELLPDGGEFESAVMASFSKRESGTTIFYRVNGGSFQTISGHLPLLQDSIVEHYGVTVRGQTTPVKTARFRFRKPPQNQDGDNDGVPDFVEIAEGTFARGLADSDEDGFSDLDELLQGTDPLDAQSHPATRGETGAAALRLRVTPLPYDGVMETQTGSLADTALRCHSFDGSFLAYGRTIAQDALPNDPSSALLRVVPYDSSLIFATVATEEHYNVRTDHADSAIGRELIGLIPFIEAPPSPPTFSFEPRVTLRSNADTWIDAAQAAAQDPNLPSLALGLDHFDTLKLVIFECLIEEILRQKGLPVTAPISLTPFRMGDRGRYMTLDLESLLSVQVARSESDLTSERFYNLHVLYSFVCGLVDAAAPADDIVALRSLTEEIYEISSRENNAQPGLYALPIDVLRGFLETGLLKTPYDQQIGLSLTEKNQALAAVANMKTMIPTRPVTTLQFEVSPLGAAQYGTDFELCTVMRTSGTQTDYALVDALGAPYQLPLGFMLGAGAGVVITAFTDRDSVCGLPALEVVKAEVVSLPAPDAEDSDGNLLEDSWEQLFFGGIGLVDPFHSLDGSGFNAFQQYLSGTDPTDANNVPLAEPITLAIPEPEMTFMPQSGQMRFQWDFGNDFTADAVHFRLWESSDLTGYTPIVAPVVYLGAGLWELEIPEPDTDRAFYQLDTSLAP